MNTLGEIEVNETHRNLAPSASRLQELCQAILTEKQASGLLRSLTPPPGTEEQQALIDFTHNDYLSLRHDQQFQELARKACRNLPAGSGASRLLGGNHPIFHELESRFNYFKGSESSLYLSSGYAANLALSSLYQLPNIVVYSDELNHASIIDGMRLGKLSRGRNLFIFPHNDMNALKKLLESQSADSVALIVTESVFSMDGDLAPIQELESLAKRYQATLLLDEAHAIGIYGGQGCGRSQECSATFRKNQLISINPCGKAMGASGAFISGPSWLRPYLINQAREFIYSTAPSPWIAATLLTCLDYLPQIEQRRQHLKNLSNKARTSLRTLGFSIANSASHIIPVQLGDIDRTLNAALQLSKRGYLCKSIRPPTVPTGSSRLRLSLSSAITVQQWESFLATLSELKGTYL